MLHRLVRCFIVPVLLLLGACQDYDFKVNDTVVYSPTLFRDFSIPDAALGNCVKQAIKDASVTQAQQLSILDCSHAGVENLDGLAVFTGLQALRLSSNQVRNLVELNRMASLEVLQLDENRIIDPVPLYKLPALRQLDLSGNPALQCPRPGSLDHVANVKLPKHCR
jgi:Leucine-rich repeat (LRR) protein